jgi:hypothetical protein
LRFNKKSRPNARRLLDNAPILNVVRPRFVPVEFYAGEADTAIVVVVEPEVGLARALPIAESINATAGGVTAAKRPAIQRNRRRVRHPPFVPFHDPTCRACAIAGFSASTAGLRMGRLAGSQRQRRSANITEYS